MESDAPILLARPHPFVQAVMSDFLAKAGFQPSPADSLEYLNSRALSKFRGAVISTSVLSKVREPFQEALGLLKNPDPSLPILFVTLAPLEQMSRKLEKELLRRDPSSRVYSRLKPPEALSSLGTGSSYLLLHKTALGDEPYAPRLRDLLHAHFRPRRAQSGPELAHVVPESQGHVGHASRAI